MNNKGANITKICPVCGYEFCKPQRVGLVNWGTRICCSRHCAGIHSHLQMERRDVNYGDPVARARYFLDQVIITPAGCFEWTGARDSFGYGAAQVDGKVWRVHRAVYNFLVEEIPNNLHVLHKCDNPPCINPDHLFVGTRSDNMKDMVYKGRGNNGSKIINDDERELVVELLRNGKFQKDIAPQFGVGKGQISCVAIANGFGRFSPQKETSLTNL